MCRRVAWGFALLLGLLLCIVLLLLLLLLLFLLFLLLLLTSCSVDCILQTGGDDASVWQVSW